MYLVNENLVNENLVNKTLANTSLTNKTAINTKALRTAAMALSLVVLTGCNTLPKHQANSTPSSEYNAFELTARADRAYEHEDWHTAEKFYRRLNTQVPEDAYGYFRLGNTLMRQEHIDGAIVAYNETLKRDNKHQGALKNRSLAYLLQAELHLEHTVLMLERQNDQAAERYRFALNGVHTINSMQLNEAPSPIEGLYTQAD